MGSVNLVVIVESVASLIRREEDKAFYLPSIIAVSAALGEEFVSYQLQPSYLFLTAIRG